MWNDPHDGEARFWRVAYHTLFYTHFYLQQDQKDFVPWVRHRDGAQSLGGEPLDAEPEPKVYEPFTRVELLEYSSECDRMIDARVEALDLSAPQCGFPWYEMPTLEHQIVNIRHIQHHAAILSHRLRRSTGIDVDWVGKG